jgi:hypothetical protein
MTKVYMMVVMDSASDNYNYGVPEEEGVPHKAFTSLDSAKRALETAASKFEEFMPTAYGKAFPYDSVTFESQLEKEKFAPWGWGVINTEEGVLRICIGVIEISVN